MKRINMEELLKRPVGSFRADIWAKDAYLAFAAGIDNFDKPC